MDFSDKLNEDKEGYDSRPQLVTAFLSSSEGESDTNYMIVKAEDIGGLDRLRKFENIEINGKTYEMDVVTSQRVDFLFEELPLRSYLSSVLEDRLERYLDIKIEKFE